METANSLAFKLESPDTSCPRVVSRKIHASASTQMGKARWFTFELSSDADLHGALDWLGTAYEAAGKNKKAG